MPTPSLLCPKLAGKRQEACGGRKGPPATRLPLPAAGPREDGPPAGETCCPEPGASFVPALKGANSCSAQGPGCAAARALRTAGPARRPRRRTPGRWGERRREEHPGIQARWAREGARSSRLRLGEDHSGAGERGGCSPNAWVPRGAGLEPWEVSAARRPQAQPPASAAGLTPPAVPNYLRVCPLVKPFLQHPLAKPRPGRSARFPPQPGEGTLVPLSSDRRRPPAPHSVRRWHPLRLEARRAQSGARPK